MSLLKLNLGCGQNPQPGYVNVDKFGSPDVKCDLEEFPWPWEDNSVEEVLLIHVLEHLGEKSDTFLKIFQELYRICRADAKVIIRVPHPRCDSFLDDPTHVRAITPTMFTLFSKRLNREFREQGASNSPLAEYLDLDFEIVTAQHDLTPLWAEKAKELSEEQLNQALRTYNNVISQTTIELKVIK